MVILRGHVQRWAVSAPGAAAPPGHRWVARCLFWACFPAGSNSSAPAFKLGACGRSRLGSCFSPRWKVEEGRRTELHQLAYSSVMNALHLYLSIDSFLHSALRLSDAALLAVLQSGLLCKAVFLFLTEIIFRSITLKMPSYLSSIKLL